MSGIVHLFAKWFQGSDKDKKKEMAERDERAKKVCILRTVLFFFKLTSMMLFDPVYSHLILSFSSRAVCQHQ